MRSLTDKVMLTGLTGGMGSGKSSVSLLLRRRFPVTVFNADTIVHELLEPGRGCWQVIAGLDNLYVRGDKTIDKVRLRRDLFADDALRKNLNEGMHPVVRKSLLEKISQEARLNGQKLFLVEVPLLFEANWLDMFSHIVVVYAEYGQCVERVMRRDHVSCAEAQKSISAQWPLLKKALLANHVVDNSGNWLDTRRQALHLGNLLWQKKCDEMAKKS
ncbi:MAG: dephospho-CoA kinase [Deltaproteobacteria bacterium]|nr:dephospho-CoA kinase [Deltaproteobacteria bacterium]